MRLGLKKCALGIGLRILGALGFALLLGSPVAASPITLDFENLTLDRVPIPNGYGGVHWDNFRVLHTTDLSGTGYANGTVSGIWIAYNGAGNPASISRASGFNLYDGYFTAAWNDGLSLEVFGFRNGLQVYNTLLTINPFGPTLVSLGFTNVDLVQFVSSGGVPGGLGSSGTQFVIDNLRLTQTPIPAALPLFATALGGLAFAARRKRVAAVLRLS
jgi:hypothetical protein